MTYDEIARHYGLTICPAAGHGDCLVATATEHEDGTVVPRETVIHWRPRRMTRSGLRRFLKVVARTRILHYYRLNRAMRIYVANRWAYRAGLEAHVRFPVALSEADRLEVRWLASHGDIVTPVALRWATRKESLHVR